MLGTANGLPQNAAVCLLQMKLHREDEYDAEDGTANGLQQNAAVCLLQFVQMKLQGEDADDAEDAEKEASTDADDARVLRASQSPPRLRLRVVAPFPLFLGWHCHGAPACSTDRFLGNPSCGTPRTFQHKTSVHV